jgi:PAS domain S-box-containing protein
VSKRLTPTPRGSTRSAEPSEELHRLARRRLAGELPRLDDVTAHPEERLVHELAVHQIELEMQNEQLRQTQAALEASRDRYAALYERAPVGYLTLQAGAIVEANRMAAEMLGCPQGRLIGRLLQDFIALEDRAAYARQEASVRSAKPPAPFDVRLEVDGADLRWVRLDMVAMHAEPGVAQSQVALTDITDHMRLQHELSRLGAVVASSEDAIVCRNVTGMVTAWNAAAARLFGVAAERMYGKTMDELVPDERREEEDRLLRQALRGEGIQQFETERRNASGATLPVSITVSPVRDPRGRVVGTAMIARDISERRRADQALRVRLSQLDAMSQASHSLILGPADPLPLQQNLLQRVAEAVGSELLMYHEMSDDSSTLVLHTSHGLPPQQAAQMQTQRIGSAESLCGIVAEQRHHLVLNHLQSSELPQARPFQDAGARCYAGFPLIARGRVYGVASFASTSVEHFREGDLQVMQTVCDQASAMYERDQLLEELHMREQMLKRADRAKDDFIATLAHELRNPLAPIRNAIGLMRHEALTMTPQVAWCRDIIERQLAQMTHLLEDLLDVSRVTRNKIELRRDRIDLLRAIEQALEATRPLIDAQRQRLQVLLPPEPIVLHGDLTRLTQVFANLLNNAAKYTDPDGRITLAVRRADDNVRVSVRDSGIGIEPLQLPRVFDMFSQLAPALERARGGLGIGLALTRGLVELHGGTIEAFSAGPGQGSEFVVHLPIDMAARARESGLQNPDDESKAPARRRLLVVDDNVDAAQTLGAILELNGHEVRVAYSGGEGLRIAAEWQPDVGVLDIGIPDLNGYELARGIRERSGEHQPLLIACTGWGQQEDVERAREAGFDHHLVKPVDPDAVLKLLAEAQPNAVR